MWVVAAASLGTVYGWPAAFGLLKPTLGPFALIGVRSRGWWIVVAGLGLVSLVMISAWRRYAQVVGNLSGFTFLYSAHDVGFVLIPVIASLGGRDRRSVGEKRVGVAPIGDVRAVTETSTGPPAELDGPAVG